MKKTCVHKRTKSLKKLNFTHRSEFFFGVVRICNDRVSAAQLWAELCSALPVHIQMSPGAVNAKTNGQGLPILLVKSELRIEATLTPNTPNLDPTLTPNTPNYSDEPGGSNIIYLTDLYGKPTAGIKTYLTWR